MCKGIISIRIRKFDHKFLAANFFRCTAIAGSDHSGIPSQDAIKSEQKRSVCIAEIATATPEEYDIVIGFYQDWESINEVESIEKSVRESAERKNRGWISRLRKEND